MLGLYSYIATYGTKDFTCLSTRAPGNMPHAYKIVTLIPRTIFWRIQDNNTRHFVFFFICILFSLV
jgi:hypothetical protein